MAAILVPRGSVHSAPALGTPTLRAVEVGRPAGASNPTKPRVWRSLAPTLLAAGCSRRWVRRRAAAEGAAAAGLSDEETQRIEAFHQTMSYNGLGVVQLPSEVIEHLRAGAVKTLAGEGPAEGFQRAKPSGGGFPPRMEWHWASDGSARETFGPVVDVLLKYLPNFQLLAAKFIVATGECSAEDAKFHQDFSPPTVPLLATATALAPVWPLAFPEKEGNLEFFTWDDMIKSKQQGSPDEVMKLINVHRYSPGEVAIFDGKLFHRTQPFSEHAFASSSLHGESEVLSKRRILASFYFAQLPEGNTWGGIVRGVLTSQGAPELG